MKYILRQPKFPVLIDSGEKLYCFTGDVRRDMDLNNESFQGDGMFHAIDSSGESFSFSFELDVLSPLTIKNKNTKKYMVDLYNSRKMNDADDYCVKNYGNTLFSKIFADIASLVLKENVQIN